MFHSIKVSSLLLKAEELSRWEMRRVYIYLFLSSPCAKCRLMKKLKQTEFKTVSGVLNSSTNIIEEC
jgi:hypothetical protein